MINSNKTKVTSCKHWLMAALLVAATAAPVLADDANILPINSRPFGKSYGQWTVAYWQWALGIPLAENPWANDTTGQFAAVGQSGPVWFLGGSLGDSVERNLTIPRGKAIFMPVHQWIFGATVGDCAPSAPGACDVPTLQASAAAAATAVQTLEVTIDGEPVRHLRDYRALSPGSFRVTLPPGNVPQALFGLPTSAGTYAPQVSDGFWLMLAPLEPGRHTIRVHVVNPSFSVDYHITYHITVNRGGDHDRDN